MAEKYDILMNKRLQLINSQTKNIEEEHQLNIKKLKLEIDALELDIRIKKKQLNIL